MLLRRQPIIAGLTLAIACFFASPASAQLVRAPLDSGFVRSSSIAVTVDEMLGSKKPRAIDEPIIGPGYPSLWIAEVQFKPVRFVRMEVTDPKTGDVNRELVWYMIYRTIPRDYTELAGDSQQDLLSKLEDPTLQPQNQLDATKSYSIQIPRFVLLSDDKGDDSKYQDQVNLEVQKKIFEREFKERASQLKLHNNVEAITEVSPDSAVSVGEPNPLANAVYGVAVWRNVSNKIDYLTVQMHGFSNAYRIQDGVVERKIVEQKFGRPGDEFNADEMEFRVLGDPSWKYVPTQAKVSVRNYDSILRNIETAKTGGDGNQ